MVSRRSRWLVGGVVSVVVTAALAAGRSSPAQGSGRSQNDGVSAAVAVASPRPVVVVLKNGARLEAQAVRRHDGRITVGFADGHSESYRIDEVDLDASLGVPPPAVATARVRPTPAARTRTLRDRAGTVKLELPDANAPQLAQTPAPSRGRPAVAGASAQAPPARSAEPSETRATAPALAELRADVQALAASWQDFGRLTAEVESDCGGGTVGRSSCGRSFVTSKRNTAYCRDAIERTRSRLPALGDQYAQLWEHARRSGIDPGEVRDVLRQARLDQFQEGLEAVRARLDAWHAGLAD